MESLFQTTSNNDAFFFLLLLPLIFLLALWSLAWKGFALWKAAQQNERGWFIALLIINSAGILEILYIFIFSKKPKKLTPSNPIEQKK